MYLVAEARQMFNDLTNNRQTRLSSKLHPFLIISDFSIPSACCCVLFIFVVLFVCVPSFAFFRLLFLLLILLTLDREHSRFKQETIMFNLSSIFLLHLFGHRKRFDPFGSYLRINN